MLSGSFIRIDLILRFAEPWIRSAPMQPPAQQVAFTEAGSFVTMETESDGKMVSDSFGALSQYFIQQS